MDEAAAGALEPNADSPAVRDAAGRGLGDFDRNLKALDNDTALPPRATPALAELRDAWPAYAAALDSVLDLYKPLSERLAALGVTSAQSQRVRRAAHDVLASHQAQESQDRPARRAWQAASASVGLAAAIVAVAVWQRRRRGLELRSPASGATEERPV
jgi:uncharacterized protein YjiS (DUF1127 family)